MPGQEWHRSLLRAHPRGAEAAEVVENEYRSLQHLAAIFPDKEFFPKILGKKSSVTIQSSAPDAQSGGSKIQDAAKVLSHLREGTSRKISWKESPVRKTLASATADLRSSGLADWMLTIEKATRLFDQKWENSPIEHIYSHGDFIPWNLRPGGFAFDWEWADYRLPWHDAFHYLWMPRILKGDDDFNSLWSPWSGADGTILRHGAEITESDWVAACSYLAWQFAFYASASARNTENLSESPLLASLHTLLINSLSSKSPAQQP